MKMDCQHCGASLTRAPTGRDGVLIKGVVVVRAGCAETTCKACGKDTKLPLKIVIDTDSLTRMRRHAP